MLDCCSYLSHALERVFNFFVWQPGHFWAVSAVFGVLFAAAILAKIRFPKIHGWPLLVAFLLWLFMGFAERDCVIHHADIRIDVVFIWPCFFVATAVLVAAFLGRLVYAVRAARDEDRDEGMANSLPLKFLRAVGATKRDKQENTPTAPPLSDQDHCL
ncbi:MAG: hypothetical protein ABFC54_01445 [Thermoguttaceae bacterium]